MENGVVETKGINWWRRMQRIRTILIIITHYITTSYAVIIILVDLSINFTR